MLRLCCLQLARCFVLSLRVVDHRSCNRITSLPGLHGVQAFQRRSKGAVARFPQPAGPGPNVNHECDENCRSQKYPGHCFGIEISRNLECEKKGARNRHHEVEQQVDGLLPILALAGVRIVTHGAIHVDEAGALSYTFFLFRADGFLL